MKKINDSAVIATTQEAILHLGFHKLATGNENFLWANDRVFFNTGKDYWFPYVEVFKAKTEKTNVCAKIACEIYWMDLPDGFCKSLEERGIIEVIEKRYNVNHPVFGIGYIVKEKILKETVGKMLYVQFKDDCIWVDETNITYIK